MLGGGTWITQNKQLPGAYINIVSAAKASATVGERGVVAIALPLGKETAGKVLQITSTEFIQDAASVLGENIEEKTKIILQELFKNATKLFIYNSTVTGSEIPASAAVITITLNATTPTSSPIAITGGTTTIAQLGNMQADSTKLSELFLLKIATTSKDWASNGSETIPSGAKITLTAKTAGKLKAEVKAVFDALTGAKSKDIQDGTDKIPVPQSPEVASICKALEQYEFNILAAYTKENDEIESYIQQIKTWREDVGKKCQVVVYNASEPDYEGVINVKSTVSDENVEEHALVAWVAGAEAGANVNESVTNKIYTGVYNIEMSQTQSELETHIKSGEFVFHRVYGDARVLEDINSLTTTDTNKGEDFKSNQTVRVIDQIANDIARIFNTKYLGVIPNDRSGRLSLWGDIVKHHNQLQDIRAIQDFDSSLVTVEQGETKKSVVINDVVIPTNAMTQLYMTVVVQ